MADSRSRTRSRAPHRPAWPIGVSGFLLMLAIGSLYGLSALQIDLSRLLTTSDVGSVVPFAAASVGLAIGCGIGERTQRTLGARRAAATGVVLWGVGILAAGSALTVGSLGGLSIALGVGGIGVGVAYLIIVATVGPSFPAQPLIGSAIGPLGFASGTAAFSLLAAGTGFSSLPADRVGAVIGGIGGGVIVIAVLGSLGLPSTKTSADTASASPRARRATRELSLLLFANAFPGMLVFAIAVDLLATGVNTSTVEAETGLAAITIALFLGGLLAPAIGRRFGVPTTFTALLILRGVLFLAAAFFPSAGLTIVLMVVALFGHGAGFSLLPSLTRSSDSPGRFTRNYSRILIVWGLAGAGAALTVMLSRAATGGDLIALGFAGAVAVLAAGWLLTRRARTAHLFS